MQCIEVLIFRKGIRHLWEFCVGLHFILVKVCFLNIAYNEQGLLLGWNLKNVQPGTAAQ